MERLRSTFYYVETLGLNYYRYEAGTVQFLVRSLIIVVVS